MAYVSGRVNYRLKLVKTLILNGKFGIIEI